MESIFKKLIAFKIGNWKKVNSTQRGNRQRKKEKTPFNKIQTKTFFLPKTVQSKISFYQKNILLICLSNVITYFWVLFTAPRRSE
jgi:hypothetical protein